MTVRHQSAQTPACNSGSCPGGRVSLAVNESSVCCACDFVDVVVLDAAAAAALTCELICLLVQLPSGFVTDVFSNVMEIVALHCRRWICLLDVLTSVGHTGQSPSPLLRNLASYGQNFKNISKTVKLLAAWSAPRLFSEEEGPCLLSALGQNFPELPLELGPRLSNYIVCLPLLKSCLSMETNCKLHEYLSGRHWRYFKKVFYWHVYTKDCIIYLVVILSNLC